MGASYLWAPDEKTKLGIYEGCYLPIENFGFKKWSVVAYLIPTKGIEHYLNEGLEEREIVERCLIFLNKPPTKRHRKSLYGTLEIYKYYFQKDQNRISISLLTDQKKNQTFLGKRRIRKHARLFSERTEEAWTRKVKNFMRICYA